MTVGNGACTYDAGDTCDGDVCVNRSPIAVISGVAGDGALRVGSAGEVLVSARESSDPDGDVLSFAWTPGAPCDASVVGDLTSEELRFDDLPVGSSCAVGLTVTDGRGLAASASATLVVRNIGGHVTRSLTACVASFDPNSDAPQGTPSTPFCAVDQALTAARAFHLAEVSLEVGTHTLVGPTIIDFPVRVRGGYAVAAPDWTHAVGSRSNLELEQGTLASGDAQLAVSDGVTLELQDLVVVRRGGCRADCALVRATQASLELRAVRLGSESVIAMPAANDAAGVNYTSVAIDAPGSDAQHFIAENLVIYGSANAVTSTGVSIAGVAEARLSDVTIRERSFGATGIRTLSAGDVSVVRANIDIASTSTSASLGFGIVDGERDTITVATCDASSVVCRGSRSITIEDSVVTVINAEEVIGVGALGTQRVDVRRSTLTVDGQQAWGVLTSAASTGALDALTIDTTTRRFRSGIQAFAVGVSDNFDDLTVEDVGSFAFALSGLDIATHIVGEEITRAAGVNLVRTSEATIQDNTIAVTGTSHLVDAVADVAGVRLLAAGDVVVRNSSIRVANLRALNGVAAIADGEPFILGRPETEGSNDLTVENVDMDVQVRADLLATVACVVAADTGSLRVVGRRAEGEMACTASGAGTVYGILTSSADDVQLRDLNLRVASVPSIASIFEAIHVGVHDGGLLASELDRASANLVVSGNRIVLDELSKRQIGIRVRGRSGGVDPILDDNFIATKRSFKNVGVLIQGTGATVALNSIRLAGCSGTCTDPYAIGVYVMHAEAVENRILGNAINVYDTMNVLSRPAIVRHNRAAGGLLPNVGVIDGNIFGSDVEVLEPPFVAAIASDANTLLLPTDMVPYLVSEVPGTGNAATPALYCPDGIHGDPTGPQRDAAIVIGRTFGVDIDGETRDATSLEAGADRIASTCP